jgi:predicted DsbA family dithiol-disulfide isomerase
VDATLILDLGADGNRGVLSARMTRRGLEFVPVSVKVVWFTDPHNIWCWGCEPTIRRLETLYEGQVDVEARQGGLFEDFSPVREQWARMSGGRWKDSVRAFFEAVAAQHRMPMDADRMTESVDDFSSTWPACLAAKAADLQGRGVGRAYLRSLREAWCLDGRPIHRRSVQEEVAAEVGLDVPAFRNALDDGSADAAFRWDREACQEAEVTGFPTFELSRENETVRIDGWQPWETFDEFLMKLDPDLQPTVVEPTPESVLGLVQRLGRCATREIAAMLDGTDDDAEILLEELEGRGAVLRRTIGRGLIWELTRAPNLRRTEEIRGEPSG